MTPQEFIRKWKPAALTERASAQEHFLDLCRVFEHPTPAEDDPTGERFTFEKGAPKTGGGDGFADVWKKGFFAWEYKKKKGDLGAALKQLVTYAAALENPPLHVVCDSVRFRIETRWTNEVPAKYEFELEDFAEPHNLKILHSVFHDPEALRSKKTREALTRDAADKFQTISDRLQHRNPDREAVAHFVNQLVFCFFADSVGLLPKGMWKKVIQAADRNPHKSETYFTQLFDQMAEGGELALEDIAAFDGGLFDGRPALRLEYGEVGLLFAASNLDWSLIDPTIFGTLFERFLDPDKRKQIGAHYTDAGKIMMIIEPVISRPLAARWAAVKAEIEAILAPASTPPAPGDRTSAKRIAAGRAKAEAARDVFLEEVRALRILDPACGSGNFLYLALQAVKNLEYRAILECETLGLARVLPRAGPEILHGIEINPFAAELARTTIWIGDIQWRVRNAITHHPRPVLRKLDSIECRDALLTPDGKGGFVEAEWPEADFIVGNPPFLGANKFKLKVGEEKTEGVRKTYLERVPPTVDLVAYWFFKAARLLKAQKILAFGLIATSAIRAGNNLKFLHALEIQDQLTDVWSDEPWVLEGASVRVSIVCANRSVTRHRLDGALVEQINSDLTSFKFGGFALSRTLSENMGVSFQGSKKVGDFEIDGPVARALIAEPLNVNLRPNLEVVRRSWLSTDFMSRDRDAWIIDFGVSTSEKEASKFEAPFKKIEETIKSKRQKNPRGSRSTKWWLHGDPQPAMRAAIARLSRYIATPEVHTHRVFVWANAAILPDCKIMVIARSDDVTFGVLCSKFHVSWANYNGGVRGEGRTYTPTTTFETYPFPAGLTPNIPAADYAGDPRAQRIAAAAKRLDDLRRAWLNPPDLVEIVPEITPTAAPGEAPVRYPDRILPRNAEAAIKLKERTLTNLYNQRPRWLADAHDALDRAVASAYGWPEEIAIEDALARLLALNLERAHG